MLKDDYKIYEEKMNKSIDSAAADFASVRAGRANAAVLDRIVVDAMLAKKRTIGVDPLPNIRDVNFVAPRGIDLTHSNYVIMDGSYYTYLYIRKGGYPTLSLIHI